MLCVKADTAFWFSGCWRAPAKGTAPRRGRVFIVWLITIIGYPSSQIPCRARWSLKGARARTRLTPEGSGSGDPPAWVVGARPPLSEGAWLIRARTSRNGGGLQAEARRTGNPPTTTIVVITTTKFRVLYSVRRARPTLLPPPVRLARGDTPRRASGCPARAPG